MSRTGHCLLVPAQGPAPGPGRSPGAEIAVLEGPAVRLPSPDEIIDGEFWTPHGPCILTIQEETALARMLANLPRFTPSERLWRSLWPGQLPACPSEQLANVVGRLRKKLKPVGIGVENRCGRGYRPHVLR